MNRRSLAVVSGLVLSSSFAAMAWSQTPNRQPTLAERMAALRRGLTGGSGQQTATDSRSSASSSAQRGAPQVDGSSLIPGNLFGRSAQQQQGQGQTTQTRPTSNSGTRVASRPRVASTRPSTSPEEAFTLPGLGGSPLPSTADTASQQGGANSDVTQERSNDYPVIQPQSVRGANSRYSAPAAQSATGSSPAVRQSPQRRSAVHMDTSDLSRELIGSFPTTPTTDSTAPAATATPTPATTPTDETAEGEPQPTPADAPLSLPADNESAIDDHANTKAIQIEATPAVPQMKVVGPGASATGERSSPSAGSALSPQSAFGRSNSAASLRTNAPAPSSTSSRNREVFGDATAPRSTDPSVLVTQQTPVITTDIRGPRQIMVGREATYRIRLDNQGTVAAEGIVASVRIPAWADVIDTAASHGTIQQSQSGGTMGLLEWQIVRLEGRASETLDVRLVPRTSRPLELGVSYTLAPVGSRAVVEVQEPKLEINVTGPDEVMFGKPQVFRLTITNPGTGVAENVKINLLPPGGGESAVSTHPLGDLPAGANKTVEVELTAREAGKLSVKAHATAEGGLASEANKEIFCRKAELEVDWRGPDQKYAGTQATYFFRVRNPGTAPAEDVTVQVALPAGAEYAGASEGQSLDADRRTVSWRVGTLGPGDDYYMELKCLMQTPGSNQVKVTATAASSQLTDSKVAETNVVALADLKLEVTDPSGPVAVGEEAIYEIRVKNRGASTAEAVNIVALFSEGIEPGQAEGALYTVADGRVTFRTIDQLPAGRQIALRIRAHALQPGTHVFRAEVICKDLEIKLAAEETTRFYTDDLPAEKGSEQQAADRSQFDEPAVR